MIERSVLSRRSTNGPVSRRSRAAASSSPCRSIGSAKRCLNDAALPSSPGLANSRIDHRSASRFSTGVPVTAIRAAGGDRADRGGLLGGRVLDRLRLVDDHPAPVDPPQDRRVAGGERVRGDHQVAAGDGRGEGLAAGPLGAVVDVHPQVRGEALRLPLPVADQRHRADEQGRADRASSPDGPLGPATAGPAAGPSCPDPCRRPAPRRSRSGRGSPARTDRAPGTAAACPGSPPARRRRPAAPASRPASRSPSQPSAATAVDRQVVVGRRRRRDRGGAARRRSARPGDRPAAARPPAAVDRARPTARAAAPAATSARRARSARRRSGCRRRPPRRSGSRRWRRGRLRPLVPTVPGWVRGVAVTLTPEPGRRLGPPARQLDPEPGGGQGGGGVAEEAVRSGDVEAEGVRPGRPEGVVQRRVEAGRLAQLGQEGLLRARRPRGRVRAGRRSARQTSSASATRLCSSLAWSPKRSSHWPSSSPASARSAR